MFTKSQMIDGFQKEHKKVLTEKDLYPQHDSLQIQYILTKINDGKEKSTITKKTHENNPLAS